MLLYYITFIFIYRKCYKNKISNQPGLNILVIQSSWIQTLFSWILWFKALWIFFYFVNKLGFNSILHYFDYIPKNAV